MNKKPLSILLTLLCFISFYGQDALPTLNISPSTPEATSFQKYGNIPVGEFTGTANIEIPIYNLELKDITLPISMSYHTGGIKVDEISSNVGLGWVLNTGGNIIRNIRGKDDFGGSGYISNLSTITNELYNRYMARSFQEYLGPEGSPSDTFGDHEYGQGIAEGVFDGEPDMYSYSYLENSGEFVYNQLGEIKSIPHKSIKIERIQGYKFLITDEFGNKFYFTENETSYLTINSQTDNCNLTNYFTPEASYTTMLYLSKIVTAKNETVNFNYQNINYEYSLFNSQSDYIADKIYAINSISKAPSKCIFTNNIIGKRITSITYEKTVISFSYSNNQRLDLSGTNALSKISLHYDSNLINEWILSQSYFESDSGNGEEKFRLKLNSLKEQGKAPYIFEYDDQYKLPMRSSYARDHWGYYNGMDNNQTLLPNTRYRNRILNGANREPSFDHTKTNILNKVIYPTGGYTQFEYESNEYLFQGQEKTYQDFDIELTVNGGVVSKTESFSIPQPGGAFADVELIFNSPPGGITPGDIIVASVYSIGSNTFSRSFEQPVSNGASFDDYPNANEFYLPAGNYEVKLLTTVNGFNGSFKLHWTEETSQQITSNKIGGGLRIKNIVDKSEIGESNYRHFLYIDPSQSNEPSGFNNFNTNYISNFSEFRYPFGDARYYDLESRYFSISSNNTSLIGLVQGNYVGYKYVTTLFGDQNGFLGKRINTYSNDLDLGRNTTIWSFVPPTSYDWLRGRLLNSLEFKKTGSSYQKVLETAYTYKINHDKYDKASSLPNESIVPGIQSIIYKPALYTGSSNEILLRREVLIMNSYHTVSGWYYIEEQRQKQYDNEDETKYIETVNKYYYDNPAHSQLTRKSKFDSNGEEIENIFYYPDDVIDVSSLGVPNITVDEKTSIDRLKKGDIHRIAEPVQVETAVKSSNGTVLSKTSQRTNYKDWGSNQVLPEFLQTLKGNYSSSNEFEERLQYHKYDDKGNPLEVSKTDGTHIVYIWGYQQIQPIAKIENATYSSIETLTGFGTNFTIANGLSTSQESTLRSIPNALVTTYTYNPLIGVTSITDPRGYTIYYEYDEFNRLKMVKDAEGNIVSKNEYNYKNN